MNKNERATRSVREIAVMILTLLEQPTPDEEAITRKHEWNKRPIKDLMRTLNYNLEHSGEIGNSCINASMLWYLKLCEKEAEQVREAQREVVNA